MARRDLIGFRCAFMSILVELLTFLREHGGKLCGSYARGEEHEGSDLDIFIPEKNWRRVRSVLIQEKFETTAIGQLCSSKFTPALEISWRFHGTKKSIRLPYRVIEGVKFKTF